MASLSSKLLRIIAALYRMNADDIEELTQQLLKQRKRIWRQTLAEEAANYGCKKSPNDPSGSDLAELKAMSREDAKSIANTWNRDVERQLEKLYKQNPRGNRLYYAKNMEAWAKARAKWKNAQIALVTDTTTREYTKSRFRAMNLIAPRFLFVGPPPTCQECVSQFAAGEVDQAHVRRYPCPRHIGCPHTWKVVSRHRIDCADIWVG